MRILKNTNKAINIPAVAEEVDFNSENETAFFISFAVWFQSRITGEYSSDINIFLSTSAVFWNEWLKDKPGVQKWLVSHEFATWEKPEDWKIEPMQKLIKDMLKGKGNIHCGKYSEHTNWYSKELLEKVAEPNIIVVTHLSHVTITSIHNVEIRKSCFYKNTVTGFELMHLIY